MVNDALLNPPNARDFHPFKTVWVWMFCLAGVNPRTFELRIFTASYNPMQKRNYLLSSEQNFAYVFPSFHLSAIQFMWLPVLDLFNVLHGTQLRENGLLSNTKFSRQVFCAIVCHTISNKACNLSSKLFTSKTSSLKQRNYSRNVVSYRTLSPKTSISLRYNSAVDFIEWKRKNKAFCICSFLVRNCTLLFKEKCML